LASTLDETNVAGARTFPRFFGRKFDALTFAKQLEHRPAHGAAMEKVLDSAFVADEPESLIDEESRDRTGWHTEALRPAELSSSFDELENCGPV
jgi:hypothetical protein